MKFRCYGVEKEPDTVKLAKMNLLLNNVRGEITEANSFYANPYDAFGAFDYVMANPPFNVDEVVVEKVIDDAAFITKWAGHFSRKNATYLEEKAYCEENKLNVAFNRLENDAASHEFTLNEVKKKKIKMPIIDLIYKIVMNDEDPHLLVSFLINKK